MLLKSNLENCVVYDVEIANEVKDVPGGWGNPYAMGLSSVVLFDFSSQRYHFFYEEDDRDRLINVFDGKIVIGFNSIKFDNRVVFGNEVTQFTDPRDMATYTEFKSKKLGRTIKFCNYDILVEYIRGRFGFSRPEDAIKKLSKKEIHDGSFKLDSITEATLNLKKSGEGAHAPVLYKQGNVRELFEYNLNDVRITKELFLFIQQHGYMIDGAGRRVFVLR